MNKKKQENPTETEKKMGFEIQALHSILDII